jgi:hypothetical protein
MYQVATVVRFLSELYKGQGLPFEPIEMRNLIGKLLEQCLTLLVLENRPKVKIHEYAHYGEQRMKQLPQSHLVRSLSLAATYWLRHLILMYQFNAAMTL